MLLSCDVQRDIVSTTEDSNISVKAVGLEMDVHMNKCSLSGSRAFFVLIKLFPMPMRCHNIQQMYICVSEHGSDAYRRWFSQIGT
jgi:hypothetical protein